MVLTSKKKKEAPPIPPPAPHDPENKFLSKAQFQEKQRKRREYAAKMAAYGKKLKEDMKEPKMEAEETSPPPAGPKLAGKQTGKTLK